MDSYEKIVQFHKYCDSCKHKDVKETDDLCHECLSEPINYASVKPIKYEKDDE